MTRCARFPSRPTTRLTWRRCGRSWPATAAPGGFPFAERGVQLSRGFRALKVWMSFKTHGVDAYAQLIHQNVRQAHYLAGLVSKHPRLELLAPAPLNVVCFRFVVGGADQAKLNAL